MSLEVIEWVEGGRVMDWRLRMWSGDRRGGECVSERALGREEGNGCCC